MKIYVVKEDSLDDVYGYENRILNYFSTKKKARKYLKELFKKYCRDHPEYSKEDLRMYYKSDFRHYIKVIKVK